MPQRIPPELFAITPPTVAASVLAGSGPSLHPCRASNAFARPSTVPGRTRARPPPSSTLTPREVAPDVDQDAVALRLAVEARAAGAERHRHSAARCRRTSPWRRRRRRAPSRLPAGTGGTGSRRTRRRSGRSRVTSRGRRRAATRARRAWRPASRPRASRGRGRVRARPNAARAASGRVRTAPSPASCLGEGHAGLDRHLDQPWPGSGNVLLERRVQLLAALDASRRDSIAARQADVVDARHVEARNA